MTSPELRKARELEHGRRIAADAERVWRRHTWAGRERLERRWADLCGRFSSLSTGQHVLELGCGTGLWTAYLANLGPAITAIDLSDDLMSQARVRVRKPHVTFLNADAECLPFPERHFDAVCGLSVLHHLDPATALVEMQRVLRPGGMLWFSEPNMLNPQIMLQKNIPWLKRWLGDTPDETAFFRWPLKRLMERAGFTDVCIQPFDFLHPDLPDSVARRLDPWLSRLESLPVAREIAGSLLVHARRH